MAATGLASNPAGAQPLTVVTGQSVTVSSTAAGAQAVWTVGFTTSASGALSGSGSATVTVTLPAGSTFGSYNDFVTSNVTDTTSSQTVSSGCPLSTGTTLTCTLNEGISVNAGDTLSVVLDGVTNPSATGPGTVSVSTSSDTTPVSKSVTITADTSVSAVSAVPSSTAAGAQVNWTIGLTASATGALPYGAVTSVTVKLPTGSTFGSYDNFGNSTVLDTTTGRYVASGCPLSTGTTVTCSLNEGYTVNAGDVLSVSLDGVTNPAGTGPGTLSVSTSSDTTPVNKSVTFTAAKAVTGVSATPTSTGVGAQVNWTVNLTTSSTGALQYGADSAVTVTLPAGSTFGSYNFYGTSSVTDTTTSDLVSSGCPVATGTTLSCVLNEGNDVSPGDALSVTLDGVTNPSATGAGTVSVSTSSDTTPVNKSVTFTAAGAVTGVSATDSSTAAGAQVDWTIGLTTSATGALDYGAASTVNVTLPSGSTFGSYNDFGNSVVTDTTTSEIVSSGCPLATGTTVSCALNEGNNVSPGDVLSVALEGVTNPTATGPGTVSVSTSSDTTGVNKSVTITTAKAVTGVSATPSSTEVGAQVNWTVDLTTSSTGALPFYSDSTVTMTLPAGSTFGTYDTYGTSEIVDTTTSGLVSSGCPVTSGTTVTCTINEGASVNAGDALAVTLDGVTNPPGTGPGSVSVSTSSDSSPVTKSVTMTEPTAVTGVSATPTSTRAGAQADWTIGFTTSATGALAYGASSTVTVTLPAGSAFGQYNDFVNSIVTDTTLGLQVSGECQVTSGTTVSCAIDEGTDVGAGDTLAVSLYGVTNPTATGPGTVTVSTSSDTTPVSKSVTITAAHSIACKKLAGKLTTTVTISKCTPGSSANKSTKGLGSVLGSTGSFKWSKSGQTTAIQTRQTSPGRGACPSGSTEYDVTGSVSGGSSTFTDSGDQVSLRLCRSSSGALILVKKTVVTL